MNNTVENDVFFINSREEGKRAYLKSLGRLRRMLKGNRYDLIHCHHSFSAVIFLLSGKWKGTRRLLSYQSDPRNEGGILLFKILYRFFDRIILKNRPKETIRPRIVYLPNGVNTNFFIPMDKTECKLKLGLDLAKSYSTIHSGQFVNGLLDNIYKELTAENKIEKRNFKNTSS